MLSVDDINKLQADNKRLNDIIDSYQPRLQRYKDILQEIKEICKNSHTSASEDYYRTADKIIQKITKAEEE